MTHNLTLDCFESLWHYGGQPSTSLPTAASQISFSSAVTRTPPTSYCSAPNPTARISCCPTPCSVTDEGNMIARRAGRSLQPLFAVMDEDGDGRLSLHEMSSLLAKLGINSTHSDNLFSLFHSTLNQHQQMSSTPDLPSLDFPQFAQLYTSLFSTAHTQLDGPIQAPVDDDGFEDELLDAFQVYDTNRDGFISAAELAAVLCELGLLPAGGIDAHLGTCQAYIDSVDLDRNGMVDFQEFKAMMKIHMNSPPSGTHRHSCSSMFNVQASGLPLTCKACRI